MISPTDADGSFIAHNAMKGLPDQAEIIPDASKICLSTDREALSREERVSLQTGRGKHLAWPPSMTDSAKKARTNTKKRVQSGE